MVGEGGIFMNGITKTIMLVLGIALLFGAVSAAPAAPAAKHLMLFEKNPADWTVVADGAWGKMMYKADMFVFNGHGLIKDTDYALINYIDPWGANPQYILLGEGSTNRGGNVNIAGTLPPLQTGTNAGAKVWLVLKSDIDGTKMTAWNPTEYLFEANLI